MKIHLIDSNCSSYIQKLIESHYKKELVIWEITKEFENPYDFANHYIFNESKSNRDEKVIEEDDIFFINLESRFSSNASNHTLEGLEFFTWLRLFEKYNHCVLYSWLPLPHILNKDFLNSVIYSIGSTYIHLPLMKDIIDLDRLKHKVRKDKAYYQDFFKHVTDVETDRHELANAVGIKRLIQLLNGKFDIGLNNKLKDSVYTYAYSNRNWGDYSENEQNESKKLLDKLNDELDILRSHELSILLIDDESYGKVGDFFNKFFWTNEDTSFKKYDEILSIRKEKGKEIFTISENKFKMKFEDFLDEFESYVDDSSNLGLLSSLDLILIDLYQFKEQDRLDSKLQSVNQISGAIVLDILRRKLPGIPIIMITGSNKSWKANELLKIGADYVWMKEGLDNGFSYQDSLINLIGLAENINFFNSTRYSPIKKMFDAYVDIEECTEALWWEEYDWGTSEKMIRDIIRNNGLKRQGHLKMVTKARKEDVLEFFSQTISLYRLLIYNHINSFPDYFIASQTFQHIGKIVEFIHNFKGLNRSYQNSITIRQFRKDTRGGKLYTLRNDSSHYPAFMELSIEKLNDNLQSIHDYLKKDPGVKRKLVKKKEKVAQVSFAPSNFLSLSVRFRVVKTTDKGIEIYIPKKIVNDFAKHFDAIRKLSDDLTLLWDKGEKKYQIKDLKMIVNRFDIAEDPFLKTDSDKSNLKTAKAAFKKSNPN